MLSLPLCDVGKRFQTFPFDASAGALPPSVDPPPPHPMRDVYVGSCTQADACKSFLAACLPSSRTGCDVSAVMSHETPWQNKAFPHLPACLLAGCWLPAAGCLLLAARLWFCCLVCEDDGKMETLCCCVVWNDCLEAEPRGLAPLRRDGRAISQRLASVLLRKVCLACPVYTLITRSPTGTTASWLI